MSEVLNLKFATKTGVKGPEGYDLYNKYQDIGTLKSGVNKKTSKKFMVATDASGNSYYVSPVKEKKSSRHPSMVLTVKQAGAEESQIVCGLFVKESNGVKTLQGKDKTTGIKYGIFPQNGERRELPSATIADLSL